MEGKKGDKIDGKPSSSQLSDKNRPGKTNEVQHDQPYNSKVWFYKNKMEKIYGPFSDEQMRSYYRQNYIAKDVLIRRGGTKKDKINGFAPLHEIFNDLDMAFLPGVGPCPARSDKKENINGAKEKSTISKRKSVRLAELSEKFRATDMRSFEKKKKHGR